MTVGFEKESQGGYVPWTGCAQPHTRCPTQSRYSVRFSHVMNYGDQIFQFITLGLGFICQVVFQSFSEILSRNCKVIPLGLLGQETQINTLTFWNTE